MNKWQEEGGEVYGLFTIFETLINDLQFTFHLKWDNRPKSFYSRQYVTSCEGIFQLEPLFIIQIRL